MAGAFRLGLAGAGRMGRTHLRALAGSELVTIAAIAEPFDQSRRQMAADGMPVHASVGEMLADGGIDGVLICVPSDQHGALVAEVAASGLPILCEKPFGFSSVQARANAAVASAAGVPLQVAYWRRYVPQLRALRERIIGGDLGTIHLVCCYQWDEHPPSEQFRAHSGGIFVDMGVHDFDQLRWLSGQDIEAISVAVPVVPAGDAVPGDVDSAQVLARLSGGSVGNVSLGRFYPGGDMVRAEVFGTAGSARCDIIDPADCGRAQLAALRLQAEDFAAFARGGASGGATAQDAVAALDAAERASAAVPALTVLR
jgi:myo-inositol 2-dehydrogenase/D-chiro-inositol 1-dehydrogenase